MTPKLGYFFCFALLACGPGASDYGLEADGLRGTPTEAAQLLVDPVPATPIGASSIVWATLQNEGSTSLQIDALEIIGDHQFRLHEQDAPIGTLAPGEIKRFPLHFVPTSQYASAQLLANGIGQKGFFQQELPITGVGLVPNLRVHPDPIVFPPHLPGCDSHLPVTLSNPGEAALTIEDLVLVGGEAFRKKNPAHTTLPLVLAPGAAAQVNLAFSGDAVREYTGSLHLNLGQLGTVQHPLFGEVYARGTVEREWVQEGPWPQVDLLVIMDRSGSMEDDASRLASAAETLFRELSRRSPEAWISVVTADDGCVGAGPFLAEDIGAIDQFGEGLFGTWGRYTESGLELAARAMEKSRADGCNATAFRPDAHKAIVIISDEADQSPDGWQATLDRIQAVAPEAQISSIIGPVPEGCGSAQPGHGYAEATMATGGVSLPLCEEDWEALAVELAREATGQARDPHPLESRPLLDTLEVRVEDEPVDGWSYDPATNAITFAESELPPSGSLISVRYQPWAACDGRAP